MDFSATISLEDLTTSSLRGSTNYCLLAPRSLAKRIDPAILIPAEFERMELFRFEADRERFLVAHSLKRIVLSNILRCSPHDIPLVFGLGNKPRLRDEQCHFNLSHSGSWIVMMISFKTEVGVDVEQPNLSSELPFSLVSHPNDEFDSAFATIEQQFYASWTLKEAMSKCDGRGLDRPFNEIRLETISDSIYRGYHEETVWYARHATLDDGAHLAYASASPLKVSHLTVG